MKLAVLLLIALVMCVELASAQDTNYLNAHALNIKNKDSLSDEIFNAVRDYKLILIGELHDAVEPAQFVSGLADLFHRKKIIVQIGIEIPSAAMKAYLENPADSNIYLSEFFTRRWTDSRPSYAWADMIAKLKRLNIETFFYDGNPSEFKTYINRDSLMYEKIKRSIQLHPLWTTIALGGNVHMMMIPYQGEPKMALYLKNDTVLKISNKMLAINCFFAEGKERSGTDSTYYQVDNSASLYATTIGFENYLCLFPNDLGKAYNGIYFTRKMTPSPLVRESGRKENR